MRMYGTQKILPVYGNYKPVERRRNNVKIAGWVPSTKQGESVSFTNTYNDTAEMIIGGNTAQNQTTQAITNPLAPNVIPFLIGNDGKIDLSLTNATNVRWIVNGTRYDVNRLQLTGLAENDIVWLCYESAASTITIDNNYIVQKIKLHLSDLQGKITHYLRLYNCNLITGSLADLQGKITHYLRLYNCNLITGSLADLQGKITYLLDLYNCNLITGSLADLQGKITYYLDLYNCNLITGSLADLQGKITTYLVLANCNLITGSLADLQGKITYYLDLYNCNLITGVYSPAPDIVWNSAKKYFYFNGTGMSTSDTDQTIINMASSISTRPNGANGELRTNARSSVSDAAVATLKSYNWTVTCGGVLQ